MWLDLPDQSSGSGDLDKPSSRPSYIEADETENPARTDEEGGERIAGLIIYRVGNGQVEYLLLKKRLQNDWSPPKGHVENNEDCSEGAERETQEETSLTFRDYEVLGDYPIYFEYKTRHRVLKKVSLWAAKCVGTKPILLSPEHDQFQWLTYEAAMSIMKRQYREALMAADLVIRTYESM